MGQIHEPRGTFFIPSTTGSSWVSTLQKTMSCQNVKRVDTPGRCTTVDPSKDILVATKYCQLWMKLRYMSFSSSWINSSWKCLTEMSRGVCLRWFQTNIHTGGGGVGIKGKVLYRNTYIHIHTCMHAYLGVSVRMCVFSSFTYVSEEPTAGMFNEFTFSFVRKHWTTLQSIWTTFSFPSSANEKYCYPTSSSAFEK